MSTPANFGPALPFTFTPAAPLLPGLYTHTHATLIPALPPAVAPIATSPTAPIAPTTLNTPGTNTVVSSALLATPAPTHTAIIIARAAMASAASRLICAVATAVIAEEDTTVISAI